MALPQGMCFRNTAGYVADPTNYDHDLGNGVTYPFTTAQGNSVGWEQGVGGDTRNRNSGNDARLAGIAFGDSQSDFRVDVPLVGSYQVGLAAGDASYARTCKFDLYDTVLNLLTLCNGSTGAANSFFDAGGNIRTAAAWPASQTFVTQTFVSTILRIRKLTSTTNCIASLYVAAAGGAAPAGGQGVLLGSARNHIVRAA